MYICEACGTDISIHALREEGDAGYVSRPAIPDISIHALREEGDPQPPDRRRSGGDFYPRPPRGGRHLIALNVYGSELNFYPRPPRGGRLGGAGVGRSIELISIHALREEGDMATTAAEIASVVFLSTPSARRATGVVGERGGRKGDFYPRPPRGGDCYCLLYTSPSPRDGLLSRMPSSA